MAEKLTDVLAEVKAAMAAENNAAPAEAPAPEGEQMVEASAEVEEDVPATPAEEIPEEAPVAPAAPIAPEPQHTAPAVDYGAMLARQNEAIQQLQQKLAEKDALVEQQARRVDETVTEALEMPKLEIGNLAYEDPAELGNKLNEYHAKMGEYIAKQIASEVAPMKQKYEAAEAEAAAQAVKNKMRGDNRFPGFGEMEADIDALVAKDPDIAHMNPTKAYATAYLLAKGLAAQKPAPARTAMDIALEALDNDEVMRIIAQKNAEKTHNTQAGAPKMAGSGPVPATPPKAPKNFGESKTMALNFIKKI